MILHNPRLPLMVGALAILGLGAYLTLFDAAPGSLSASHSRIEGLTRIDRCVQCHAKEGLEAGCLHCHEEIAEQLAASRGLHVRLLEGKPQACEPCHREHLGASFPLITRASWGDFDPERFEHRHVAFSLEGKHGGLPCGDCHARKEAKPFTLPAYPALARGATFLGQSQECVSCHPDAHAGTMSLACEECHGQEAFKPAPRFDHTRFYPLLGAHATAPCAGCHVAPREGAATAPEAPEVLATRQTLAATAAPVDTKPPEGMSTEGAKEEAAAPLVFKESKGKRCVDCHENPHHAPWQGDCESCHPNDGAPWSAAAAKVTIATHAQTGFRLEPPHEQVACEKCHAPSKSLQERYPDPSALSYRRGQDQCDGCHRDVHGGQFLGRADGCLGCHLREAFTPHNYVVARHTTFALAGAHNAVPCNECHKAQKPGAAESIVSEKTDADSNAVRQFVGTARDCKGCHADPHGGQFRRELDQGDCNGCHPGTESFAIRPYDHEVLARFALQGKHAAARCEDCHRMTGTPVGGPAAFRVYRDTKTACSSCHADVHQGQFQVNGATSCERCHSSAETWSATAFHHNRDAAFLIDGSHREVLCSGCHPRVKVGGVTFVQYKPIGKRCEDCHGFSREP